MNPEEFRDLAASLWERVPSRFKERIENVALLIEEEPPSDLDEHDLLGLYQGIPLTLRGEGYGVGGTLPDTITLYRIPILRAAQEDAGSEDNLLEHVERVTAETLWHEVGHYFGLTEEEIQERESEGSNLFIG